jgi:hypothetical protein
MLWIACHTHHVEYDPYDKIEEAYRRERLREITEARDNENMADEARLIREMLNDR